MRHTRGLVTGKWGKKGRRGNSTTRLAGKPHSAAESSCHSQFVRDPVGVASAVLGRVPQPQPPAHRVGSDDEVERGAIGGEGTEKRQRKKKKEVEKETPRRKNHTSACVLV